MTVLPTTPVASLIGAPVATIRPSATLREAADALAADQVGLLVVVDANGVQGVVSERDIVSAIADDVELDVERVREVATLDLLTIEDDATVLEATKAMLDAQIRHLAVARKGVITGVVSIRDVAQVLVSALDD